MKAIISVPYSFFDFFLINAKRYLFYVTVYLCYVYNFCKGKNKKHTNTNVRPLKGGICAIPLLACLDVIYNANKINISFS